MELKTLNTNPSNKLHIIEKEQLLLLSPFPVVSVTDKVEGLVLVLNESENT